MADIRRTGYLDDFQRVDESPLSYGGRWRTLFYHYGTVLSLVSNEVEVHAVTGGTAQASYWAESYFKGDVECWGNPYGGSDLREGLSLYLHLTNTYADTGLVHNYNGYRCRANVGIGIPGTTTIDRVDDGVPTNLAVVAGGWDMTQGIVLFRRIGSVLENWSTSDSTGTTGWTLRISATDSTYGGGFLAISTEQDDPNPSWSGFGGGSRNKSRFIRYVSN